MLLRHALDRLGQRAQIIGVLGVARQSVGQRDGPNIPVTAGSYLVTFDPDTAAYDFQAQ